MTKQEILDKINTGIRGQGSMVDIGGALADILNELVDAMGGEPVVHQVTIQSAEELMQEVDIDFVPILGEYVSFMVNGEEFVRGQIISVAEGSAPNTSRGCVCTMGDDNVSPTLTSIYKPR